MSKAIATKALNGVLLLSAAAALAACGGGSGGGDDSASADPVAITPANAGQVAGTVYDATTSLEGAGLGGTGALTGVVSDAPGGGADAVKAIVSQLKASRPWFAVQREGTVTGAVVTETTACAGGGTATFTLDDADGNQDLSTGDSITMAFDGCAEGTTLLNGVIGMTNVALSGDLAAPPYSLQLTIQANNFTVTENGETTSLNGGMTLSEATDDGVLFTHGISGSSIAVSANGAAAALSAFNLTSTQNLGSGAYSLHGSATVSSTEIGGSVTMVTTASFEGVDPNPPYAGQAIITGANNSSVTLIADDEVNVTLLVDANGDGVTDQIIPTTWAEL